RFAFNHKMAVAVLGLDFVLTALMFGN
ncbi:hypothetical protein Q604_UNBC03127G0002, partial [human gut metagenome]